MNNVIELIENIQKLKASVKRYITETPHFLLYWISNSEVQHFIKEFPEDYEKRFDLEVDSLGSSPTVEIIFRDHPDEVKSIMRYCNLETFREIVKSKWKEYGGKIKEYRIHELEEDLNYYKEQVIKIENELKTLKNGTTNS